MNYCILNGKKSTMVKGLLIQSLPSIIKPLMRTRVEEIDGRDGEIITQLGYAAYDKEMSIGLFGDYDISEVIDYFNSEGEVIFSNELNRVYKYKIINQIDFERLGIFKTAVVTFRVEPFKYSSVDDSITITDGAGVTKSKTLTNYGNVYSKPLIYIYGCPSSFTLTLDGKTLTISSPTSSNILIDVDKMNAYYLSDGSYANRAISGDYSAFALKPKGLNGNVLTWTGTCSQIVIKNLSRWI